MDKNKISSVKKDKRSWFGKDRKTSFRSAIPNNRYFNGKIKEVQKTFIHQNKKYLEQHNPELLYSLKNQPPPKKNQPTTATTSAVVTESKKEKGSGDELRQHLENRDRQRKEELAKQNKVSVTKPFTFSNVGKKDPCRGMGWVNPFEPINKNRLGHSQTWRDNKSKKKYY